MPSLAKNFRKNIEKGVRDKGPKVEALFERALALAIDYNAEGWNKGQGLKKLKKPLLALYDKLLFGKIRENFGGRLAVLRRRRGPARHRDAAVLLRPRPARCSRATA